jgi:serine/threonine protein kinase
VEFLVHVALAAGVASVNSLAEAGHLDREQGKKSSRSGTMDDSSAGGTATAMSRSEHVPIDHDNPSIRIQHQRVEKASVTGAPLDLQWRQLHNVEYLTDGGNSWVHTAVFQGRPIVVKTLKPECQDVALAINEIEAELEVHSRLDHQNIVALIGAGTTSKKVRFIVLERLDGGTVTQILGYDTRIRDRRRRFWRRKQFSFVDVLRIARSIASAMTYLHEEAIPGSIVLHRDLKPDNIGTYYTHPLATMPIG